MKKIGIRLAFLVLPFLLSGCGYKLGSMTVGGIKTIAIVAIENSTGKPFIEESDVINTLIQKFNQDGSVRVVSEDLADAILKVDLVNYNQRAEVFTDQDIGEQFRLFIYADIVVTALPTKERLMFKRVRGEAEYDVSLDQSEIERIQSKRAIEDLSVEIVRSVIEGGW